MTRQNDRRKFLQGCAGGAAALAIGLPVIEPWAMGTSTIARQEIGRSSRWDSKVDRT